MKLPIYAPLLKEFYFNSDILKAEINTLVKSEVQERTLPFVNGASVYDQQGLLNIASNEDLNATSKYYLDENGVRVPVPGKFKTYHVSNLTYLPEEPESMTDIYRMDDPKKTIFWHKYHKQFLWKEELLGSAIKKAVEQFPWEYVQGVRLIYMNPPSIGQIHRDSSPISNQRYFNDGFASISFNIDSGGGVLNYLDKDNKQQEVDNNVKIFHFDDSTPHGVTPITSERYQLRMWGKLSVPYTELFQK
jgi:hypothetical protein